jgi:hypothetical protein
LSVFSFTTLRIQHEDFVKKLLWGGQMCYDDCTLFKLEVLRMNLRNVLALSLAFFLTVPFVYAERRAKPDGMKASKPVVCAAYDKEYSVGDKGPANGWIIYKKPVASGQSEGSCWQYLEAAPLDSPTSAWSNVTDKSVSGTSTGVGNGQDNTKKIIAQAGHTASAAKVCSDLVIKYNGQAFKGWFLPSRDELDLMYQLLAKGDNKGGFVTKYNSANDISPWYWSSSEIDEFNAWGRYFSDGVQDFNSKYGTNDVRCARAF